MLGKEKLIEHKGGYDEFVVDLTDALAKVPADKKGVPLAVLCDNSRRMDTIPSDFSDFSLYGGLYRHVELVYVPAVAIEALHVHGDRPRTTERGRRSEVSLHVVMRPGKASACRRSRVRFADPNGEVRARFDASTVRVR